MKKHTRKPAERRQTASTAARRGHLHDRALWAGAATADITPPRPELLTPTGMGRLVPTRGVLDPLRVDALALAAGGNLAFVTTSDLRTLFMEGRGLEELTSRVAQATGCDPTRVLLSAVHNHCSSPEAADSSHRAQAALREANEKIINGFVEACVRAKAALRPAEIAASTTTLSAPVGVNRRAVLSNGTGINSWGAGPIVPFGHRVVGPAGPDSTRADILAVREIGATRPFAILTCYHSHPHLYELPYFSGEFPGGVKRRMELAFPGAVSLHASAVGGDIDLHTVHPKPDYEPQQVKWFQESVELLSDRFVRAVAPAVPDCGFFRPERLQHEYYSSKPHETPGSPRLTIINAVALGNVALVSMPGEIFHACGLDLLARSPFPHTCLMGYNGSREGYAPPALAFEQGSYEVMRGPAPDVDPPGTTVVRARPWTAQKIVEKVLEILCRLARC